MSRHLEPGLQEPTIDALRSSLIERRGGAKLSAACERVEAGELVLDAVARAEQAAYSLAGVDPFRFQGEDEEKDTDGDVVPLQATG